MGFEDQEANDDESARARSFLQDLGRLMQELREEAELLSTEQLADALEERVGGLAGNRLHLDRAEALAMARDIKEPPPD